MERRTQTNLSRKRVSPLVALGTFMLGVAALYWGKPVLIPVTVAILLTFLLNPVVNLLHRWGLRRAVAVLLVVFLVFSLLGTVTYALGKQVTALAAELPQYKDNFMRKVTQFRTVGRSKALEKLERTFRDVVGEIQRQDGAADEHKQDGSVAEEVKKIEKPVPVVVQGDRTPGKLLPVGLGSVMEWGVTAVMVVVLVIFMLLRLQDLRNRMLRLVGYGRLTTTTKALDEAGERISRYLLMQSIINTTYGLCIGAGLYLIGLPYVVLLGFIAGTMRFVPYVGPPLGAVLPLVLSLALLDGWMSTVLVIGLFVVLEAVTSMILEPLLYGQSAGVSEVALLIAIAFWTWLWGPLGLALATPLTVCLVVLCKYIPELEFAEVLLGDESVVDPPLIYYQRLLARDTDEASDIVKTYLQAHPEEGIYDDLFIPALHWAKRDGARDKLDVEDQRLIVHTTRELIETLEELNPNPSPHSPPEPGAPPPMRVQILACPARDAADELSLLMLGRLLDPKRFEVEVLSCEKLFSEMMGVIRQTAPDVICVASLTPDPIASLRRLCKRLRDSFPETRLVACRWGHKEAGMDRRDQLLAAGADFSARTILETRNHLLSLFPVLVDARSADSRPDTDAEGSVRAGDREAMREAGQGLEVPAAGRAHAVFP